MVGGFEEEQIGEMKKYNEKFEDLISKKTDIINKSKKRQSLDSTATPIIPSSSQAPVLAPILDSTDQPQSLTAVDKKSSEEKAADLQAWVIDLYIPEARVEQERLDRERMVRLEQQCSERQQQLEQGQSFVSETKTVFKWEASSPLFFEEPQSEEEDIENPRKLVCA